MTPIEGAIDIMENMNCTLRTLVSKYKTDSDQDVNPLTMRLNGVLDAAVMGGFAKYQEVFIHKIECIVFVRHYN